MVKRKPQGSVAGLVFTGLVGNWALTALKAWMVMIFIGMLADDLNVSALFLSYWQSILVTVIFSLLTAPAPTTD